MPAGDIYQVNNEFKYEGNENTYSSYLRVEAVADEDTIVDSLLAFAFDQVIRHQVLTVPTLLFECNSVRQVWPDTSLPKIQLVNLFGSRSCTPALIGLPG